MKTLWMLLLLLLCIQTQQAWKISTMRNLKKTLLAATLLCSQPCYADMLTFPIPAPLKNTYALARSAECFADSRDEVQTNPVKKLATNNALTMKGREQAKEMAKKLNDMNFVPTFIWTSNTERAYETGSIIAKEIGLGQNRLVPEYSFLDARSAGIFEGKNIKSTWKAIHYMDEKEGINYKPPPNNDGTPTESVSDVLVRDNQLISSIETSHGGEQVLIIAPDSDVLSIITAALSDANPDIVLPSHAKYSFQNAEIRMLNPLVKEPTTLATGQTKEEARASTRRMRAVRVGGSVSNTALKKSNSWFDIWEASVDRGQILELSSTKK